MATGRKSTFRRVLGWVQIALTIAVVVFWFFELRPQGLGGPASYAIVSGKSMNPLYHTGDVVIVHSHPTYHVRDIVAYKVPKPSPQAGLEVIHRLIGGNGTAGWVVKGDNRTAPDLWHPKNSDIVGSAWLHIPSAGVVVRLLHTPIFIAGFLALLAVLVVLKKAPSGPKPDPEPPAVAAAPPDPAPEPEPQPEPEPEPEPAPVVAPPAPVPVEATVVRPVTPDHSAELARLAAEVEALRVERASLQAQLDQARRELASAGPRSEGDLRQRELESALTSALLSAAHAGAELRLQAHREAEAILAEARERAAGIEQELGEERQRAVSDLRSLRNTLETSLAALDDATLAPPPPHMPVDDLFETDRLRARTDEPR